MIFATIGIMIVAILLVLVVLIQNSKGGGISSSVGISNQVMGAARSTENVEKMTWILVGTLAVACVLSGLVIKTQTTTAGPNMGFEKIETQYDIPQNPVGQINPNPTLPNPGGQPTK